MEIGEDSYVTPRTAYSDDACRGNICSVLTSCRSSSSESSQPTTEHSSVTGRVTTLWSKYAVALNDIELVQIVSHVVVRDHDSNRQTVAYTLDMYVNVSDIGLYIPWTQRQPHYQLQHRYSDCRAMRFHLLASVRESNHGLCEFCSCMLDFLTTYRFPKRCPSLLVQFVPGWRACLVSRRKIVLQSWFNRLLFVARHLSSKGSASLRCDGFVNVMYILKDFLLEPSTRLSCEKW
ncbi:hypothetical protein LEN26_007613 [Aphanomyces euteiches]|nr:hypothetical protein AeMF1_009199 [Aphanomyces euteiches]KAH9131691.1 hypothetical protein LEN26_007613 [Aphanomyces euteiches]KAH9197105.1 hypothetical protein AeNC1_000914 [Aphanomyces euteiches]